MCDLRNRQHISHSIHPQHNGETNATNGRNHPKGIKKKTNLCQRVESELAAQTPTSIKKKYNISMDNVESLCVELTFNE